MTLYEAMIIVDTARCSDDFDSVAEHVQGILRKNGADVKAFKRWDERKLAYSIRKHTRGVYLLVHFTAPPEAIAEITREYRLSDTVLRSLITKAAKPEAAQIAEEQQPAPEQPPAALAEPTPEAQPAPEPQPAAAQHEAAPAQEPPAQQPQAEQGSAIATSDEEQAPQPPAAAEPPPTAEQDEPPDSPDDSH